MALPAKVSANPTKSFFIDMITRDIALEDCLLDLLDNCIDGARRLYLESNPQDKENLKDGALPSYSYANRWVRFTFNPDGVVVSDNCGGISLSDAVDYAFHFGRVEGINDEDETPYSIGLYGIGMKRAVLKLGKDVKVSSFLEDEPFVVSIDVDAWKASESWDFDLSEPTAEALAAREEVTDQPGTSIEVGKLNDGIWDELGDPEFVNRLRDIIARDYAFMLDNGLEVYVDDKSISPHPYTLLASDEFSPVNVSYTDESTGVHVDIVAGMAAPPPDTTEEQLTSTSKYFGWYVACNERIVLAGDKTTKTGWGMLATPSWHAQYNGFLGIVRLAHVDARKLPWGTTKRELVLTDPLYRRVQSRMRDATRAYVNYTNQRKADLAHAKVLEKAATPVDVRTVQKSESLTMPNIKKTTVRWSSIQYSRPKSEIAQAAQALGNRRLSNSQVGIRTFEYFMENEVD